MANITIYSTPACPWCRRAKQYLTEQAIPFSEIDVAADVGQAEEMIKKSGQMGVPVIDIDGKIVIGFDKFKIDELLGIKQ